MNAAPYDFRKPSRLAGELEEKLAAWFTSALALVPDRWAKHQSIAMDHLLFRIDTSRCGDALNEWESPVVAYRVAVGALQTLMIFPRPLMLALVAGMLGDACLDMPADRALTTVEESLAEYLLQRFLDAFTECGPDGDPVVIELKQLEPVLKRARIVAPDESVARCTVAMRGPFGEPHWQWLLPQDELAARLGRVPAEANVAQDHNTRARLTTLVAEMPLEVSVRLGSAVLHVSELVGMRSGDVVILDQPVSQPLAASVAGKTRFHVWPGRVGAKQAFQVESLIES